MLFGTCSAFSIFQACRRSRKHILTPLSIAFCESRTAMYCPNKLSDQTLAKSLNCAIRFAACFYALYLACELQRCQPLPIPGTAPPHHFQLFTTERTSPFHCGHLIKIGHAKYIRSSGNKTIGPSVALDIKHSTLFFCNHPGSLERKQFIFHWPHITKKKHRHKKETPRLQHEVLSESESVSAFLNTAWVHLFRRGQKNYK